MKEWSSHIYEQAAAAFSKQAIIFDTIYDNDIIIQYKRKRVRDHVMRFLPPLSQILELNAGTGDDAVYFAQQGHTVHATDISTGMQEMLIKKIKQNRLENKITHEFCSFTELENLQD